MSVETSPSVSSSSFEMFGIPTAATELTTWDYAAQEVNNPLEFMPDTTASPETVEEPEQPRLEPEDETFFDHVRSAQRLNHLDSSQQRATEISEVDTKLATVESSISRLTVEKRRLTARQTELKVGDIEKTQREAEQTEKAEELLARLEEVLHQRYALTPVIKDHVAASKNIQRNLIAILEDYRLIIPGEERATEYVENYRDLDAKIIDFEREMDSLQTEIDKMRVDLNAQNQTYLQVSKEAPVSGQRGLKLMFDTAREAAEEEISLKEATRKSLEAKIRRSTIYNQHLADYKAMAATTEELYEQMNALNEQICTLKSEIAEIVGADALAAYQKESQQAPQTEAIPAPGYIEDDIPADDTRRSVVISLPNVGWRAG